MPTDGNRVVVVGSGFAGYLAARRLGRLARYQPMHLTLLSATDGLLYSPLLPDVAVGALNPRSIVVPSATLDSVDDVRGDTFDIDLSAREVHYRDLDGAEHVAPYDRRGLCGHRADRADGSSDRPAAPTLFQPSRRRRRWLLVDVAHTVMPELGPDLGQAALQLLRRRRVDVRLGVSLEEVGSDSVTLTDHSVLPCQTVVWCAGVTANPIITSLGLPTERGRLVVDTALRVAGHPEVYAIGDAAAVPDLTKPANDDGTQPICPPTAQHAMRQAAAARNIAAALGYGEARPYRHRDLGLVVDLGGPDAAATPLGLHVRGRLAKVITRGYHLYALPTASRRLRVLADWALTAPTTWPSACSPKRPHWPQPPRGVPRPVGAATGPLIWCRTRLLTG